MEIFKPFDSTPSSTVAPHITKHLEQCFSTFFGSWHPSGLKKMATPLFGFLV
jgi:hypothetical protein